jgi:hypothetical protein
MVKVKHRLDGLGYYHNLITAVLFPFLLSFLSSFFFSFFFSSQGRKEIEHQLDAMVELLEALGGLPCKPQSFPKKKLKKKKKKCYPSIFIFIFNLTIQIVKVGSPVIRWRGLS